MTTETWRVIDEAGVRHEIEVGQVRDSVAWCARVRSYEAPVAHDDARGAVVLAAMRDGVGIAEVLAPGAVSREEMAAEVAHLEARRGALLAEVDRLTASVATARLDGAREMQELVLVTALNAESPRDIIDALLSLPLPGEEVARG